MAALKNYFPSAVFFRSLFVAVLLACAMVSTARAQITPQTPEEKKASLYNVALNAFNKGDFATAISNFEQVIPLAKPDDNLEGLYFYLGAAYFNSQQYDKAVETFKKFQTGYPKSARLAEVLFSIAQADLLNKNWDESITYFKLIEDLPEYHETALYYEAIAYKSKDTPDDDNAINVLERLVLPEIHSGMSANGAILLVELYGKKKELDKASDMVKKISKKLYYVDDLMTLNQQAMELGDGCLQDDMPEQALLCYRLVHSKDDVIAFQTSKLQLMAQQIVQLNAAMQLDRQNGLKYMRQIAMLKAAIVNGQKRLEDYKSQPDVMSKVLLRIGRAFYKMDRPWESTVAFDELLTKYPDSPEVEPALFSVTVSSAQATRPEATRKYAAQYLKQFPQGTHTADVTYLVGLACAQAEDWQGLVDAFTKALKDQPDSKYKEEMVMQLGNAYFSLSKFNDAAKQYAQYKADFATGSHMEEASYRYALTFLFLGKYEDAMSALNEYITNYPKGFFVADAKYRLDMCKYAANLYPDVITDCRQWEKDYPKDPLLPEVLALLADSLDAADQDNVAIQVYIRAAQLAQRDETRDYAMGAAEKLLQKQGDWEKIGNMYEDFVKMHPDNPSVPQAVYWIGRAKLHDGDPEEAKKFIADAIGKYIDDPRRDAVEQMIMQLDQIALHKKRATPTPSPSPVVASGTATSGTATSGTATVAVTTPTPSPSPTPVVDPMVELENLLKPYVTDNNPTAQARVLFAKAQFAFMRNQIPEEGKNYQAIADKFQPKDLSSIILAMVGDYLLEKGQNDKARAYFSYLLDEYPKSDMLDYAYNGLAQLSYNDKDYDKALQYYTDAMDKGVAAGKMKELTIGKARTLLALKKFDEAKKVFEEVANRKDWRGAITAESIVSMGDLEQSQAKFNDAIKYYQRVYVGFQRYPQWVAKAYLQSGICFEQTGDKEAAKKTYQEMLSNEKLLKFPEADEARKRLEALGAVGSR
ncbi:MAG TPA: tetratricopeptide repeat protein [Chthoniobacteraceae bacterium]|nr:tetratricopeptide repeat protein [Chthoniobacteraceae bacterium]